MNTKSALAESAGEPVRYIAMKKNKHTPSPWHIDNTFWAAPEIVTDERRVAKVLYDKGSEDREVIHNACLISAAPDLLDACIAFVEAYEKSLQLEKTDIALSKAKKAIEKAQYNSSSSGIVGTGAKNSTQLAMALGKESPQPAPQSAEH